MYFVLSLALATLPGVAAGGAGTSEIGELDLPVSALSAAVGGRSAGLVDDASAVADNPARLGAVAGGGAAATHTMWPMGFADSMLALFVKVPAIGHVGGQVRSFRASMTESVEDVYGAYTGDGGEFSYQTVQVSLGCSPDLSSLDEVLPARLRVGIAAFSVHRDAAGEKANGAGVNAGMTLGWGRRMEMYATARNLGGVRGGMTPLAGAAGLVGRFTGVPGEDDRFAAAVEGFWSREAGPGAGLAVEYVTCWSIIEAGLRAGYTTSAARSAGVLPTAGIVLRIAHMSFEFGLASFGEIGVASVLSVSYQERRPER